MANDKVQKFIKPQDTTIFSRKSLYFTIPQNTSDGWADTLPVWIREGIENLNKALDDSEAQNEHASHLALVERARWNQREYQLLQDFESTRKENSRLEKEKCKLRLRTRFMREHAEKDHARYQRTRKELLEERQRRKCLEERTGYTCPICYDATCDVVLRCGHEFCGVCIKFHCETLRDSGQASLTCPVCRATFGPSTCEVNQCLITLHRS